MFADQPSQPTAECARLTQRRQVSMRLEERFLGDVLRQMTVADSGEGNPVCEVLIALNEALKGVSVPALRGYDELDDIVHGSTSE